MVISAKNYSDFKLLANSLRRLDLVCYAYGTAVLNSSTTYNVAYAFDYQAGHGIALESPNSFTMSSSDFPGAVSISDRLNISDQSALSTGF